MPNKTISAYLAALGRKGGQVKSENKAKAARANGLKRQRKPDNEITPAALYQRKRREKMKKEKDMKKKMTNTEYNLNWMKETRPDLVAAAKRAFANGETRVWLVLSDSFDQNPNIWTEADRDEILSNYAKYDSSAEESQTEVIARYNAEFDSDRCVIKITPDML